MAESQKDDRREVFFSVTINSIEALSESTQSFNASLFLSLYWMNDTGEHGEPWLDWMNGRVSISERKHRPGKTKGDHDRLTMTVNGTFTSEMKLQSFPVDDQKISITLMVGADDDIVLKPWREPTGTWSLGRGNPLVQWQPLLQPGTTDKAVVDVDLVLTDPAMSSSGGVYAQAEIHAYLYRKSQAWMWNVMVPAALLSTAILIHFGLDARDSASRVKVDFAVIFTVIGLKFIVAQRLPMVPYLTVLDWYLLLCLAMCVFVALQASCMKLVVLFACDGSYEIAGGTVDQFFECPQLLAIDMTCLFLDIVLFAILHGKYMMMLRSRMYHLEHGDFVGHRHLFGSGQTISPDTPGRTDTKPEQKQLASTAAPVGEQTPLLEAVPSS